MKRLNFSIRENYAVDVGGHSLDLHNDFDFSGVFYDAERNRVSLSWERAVGSWVSHGAPKNVKIIFDVVSFFRTQLVPNGHQSAEGRTLSFVGYLRPEDAEVMDGYLDEADSDESFHMIFGFENDLSVKVYADLVSCILEGTTKADVTAERAP